MHCDNLLFSVRYFYDQQIFECLLSFFDSFVSFTKGCLNWKIVPIKYIIDLGETVGHIFCAFSVLNPIFKVLFDWDFKFIVHFEYILNFLELSDCHTICFFSFFLFVFWLGILGYVACANLEYFGVDQIKVVVASVILRRVFNAN